MARPSSKDPLDKFRWEIRIEGAGVDSLSRAGFVSVETPSVTYNVKEYAEGGNHLHPRLIVDGAAYRPITLTRGVTKSQDFAAWASLPIYVLTGAGDLALAANPQQNSNALNATQLGPNPVDYRRTITINHLDRTGKAIKSYRLYDCIPVEFQAASDFAADADDSVSMEKLVIRYESFEVISEDAAEKGPFNITDTVKRLFRNI